MESKEDAQARDADIVDRSLKQLREVVVEMLTMEHPPYDTVQQLIHAMQGAEMSRHTSLRQARAGVARIPQYDHALIGADFRADAFGGMGNMLGSLATQQAVPALIRDWGRTRQLFSAEEQTRIEDAMRDHVRQAFGVKDGPNLPASAPSPEGAEVLAAHTETEE